MTLSIKHLGLILLTLACHFGELSAQPLTADEEAALIRGLGNPDINVQIAAISSIKEGTQVSDKCIQTFIKMNMNAAIEAKASRDPVALSRYVTVTSRSGPLFKGADPKAAAVVCRPYFEDPATVWLIIGLIQRETPIVIELAPEFTAALSNENENVRSLAARALGTASSAAKDAIPKLTEMSKSDPSEKTRNAANSALRDLGVTK